MKKFLALLFLSQQVFASYTVPNINGASDATLTPTLNVTVPYSQATVTGTKTSTLETGNENLLLNPNFEHSTATTSWTIAAGSSAAVETTEVKSGKQSLLVTMTAVNGISISQDVTPAIKLDGSNLEHGVWLKTASTTLTVCARNAAATVGTCAIVQGDSKWHFYPVLMAGPASGSVGVSVVTTSSTTGTYYIDAGYVGLARNIGAGVPNNVFSAKVNAAGVVADENEDFINGNASVTDTSLFAITFNTSKFSVGPTCTVTPAQTTATVSPTIKFESASTTTGISVRTYDSSTAAKAAYSFHITCTRAGTDFIQPTITASQWDYGPTAYTPGTGNMPTLSSSSCDHSRKGSKVTVVCKFVASGTGAAGQLSVGLPTGIALSTSTSPVGTVKFLDNGVAHRTGNVTVSGSNFVFYLDSATAAMQGTDITTGDELQFSITFPVSGWTENQNAPQLVGSVTSNTTGALRLEGANVNNTNGSVAVNSSTSSWITASSCSGAGTCAFSIAGSFSVTPYCTCSANGSSASQCVASTSSTTVTINTWSPGGVLANENNVKILCLGNR